MATLRLGQTAEEAHDEVVRLAVGIYWAANLGDPELDAVVAEDREHELELRTGKGALRLADHEMRPATRGIV
jgi:hypothetical protein